MSISFSPESHRTNQALSFSFFSSRYTKNLFVRIDGFSHPVDDAGKQELDIWRPNADNPPKDLNLREARFILSQVADRFCDLYSQELVIYKEYMEKSSNANESGENDTNETEKVIANESGEDDNYDTDKVIVWKRVVRGVREMCDVCETTLFNYHWMCKQCGFGVCIDCVKARNKGETKVWSGGDVVRDDYFWLMCNARNPHKPEQLILAQIIAGNEFSKLAKQVHAVRAIWGISQECECKLSKNPQPKDKYDICQQLLLNNGLANDDDDSKVHVKEEILQLMSTSHDEIDTAKLPANSPPQNGIMKFVAAEDRDNDNSALSVLADVAIKNEEQLQNEQLTQVSNNGRDDDENSSVSSEAANLQDLLLEIDCEAEPDSTLTNTSQAILGVLDEKVSNKSKAENSCVMTSDCRGNTTRFLPNRIMTINQSNELYPEVPHDWLCEGRLLRLHDPICEGNIDIFQEQWKRGQPVITSEVSGLLDMNLWRPEAFSRDFGEDANDLINCMTGTLVPNQPMKRFWDGFEYINKRIKDENGTPMLLKLKDWPPGEDFAETLPTRFTDLMRCLPLPDYTKRDGKFNLASRLPDIFVRPDLGPKMYNAYGSALYPTKGTTNLHLDISDAVNVMVYVGIPKDTGTDVSHVKEAYRAIRDAGCDILTQKRVLEEKEYPGALWHIYAPRDADRIRDLLNKVAVERDERIEPNHDPIHDQCWYLDSELRRRLYEEHNVQGYPIVQCLGDAVFIPAGAPHQVQNLHNCVKVAEDFVSPENVSACFHLTHEFRGLSDTHSNHEDKLQIKNIIYHAVKDAISTLAHTFNKHTAAIKSEVAVTEMIKEDILNEEPNI